ncbi:AAA family ATPase [Ignatzschineria cameli]|uniref:AAA family ATPase n=1 Tax=Ignatzschineria cameli TaxID=2182793 RepID=UPI0013004831|nr:AAA family ATPase [Ignatzschineria cameli]
MKGKSRRHPEHLYKYKDVQLLKFSAIYGANGAGKSNLIKAFKFSKDFISNNNFPESSTQSYCRTKKKNKDLETSFEYEIIIDNKMYSYGFSILLSKKIIKKEWLYEITNSTENAIFTLDFENNDLLLDIDKLISNTNDKERLKIYINDFKSLSKSDCSLFLHFINKGKSSFDKKHAARILNLVYRWFSNKLEVISPSDTTNRGLTYLDENDDSIENFLKDFGTGINSIKITPISLDEMYKLESAEFIDFINDDINKHIDAIKKHKSNVDIDITAIMRTSKNLFSIKKIASQDIEYNVIKFTHYADNETYKLSEESDGTIRLLELYDVIKNKQDKIFIIDELDRSLHPNLTYNFVKMFLSLKNKSQLIVSTHEDRILDLNIMRRDEIWFVEKNDIGESKLYSLEQFKTRFDKDVMNAYLDGRYGSIPKFKFLNNY